MLARPDCPCERCYRRLQKRGYNVESVSEFVAHKVHHVNLATSLGEHVSCGRAMGEVVGAVTPFWPLVTCRSCRMLQPAVDFFKVYPRPDSL